MKVINTDFNNEFKMKANIVIKSAKQLPKLGLSSQPSAYIIIKVGDEQVTTAIVPQSCSPTWNQNTELTSNSQLSKVTVFVYNSNPNDVDELLGVGYTQFQTFLTPALTLSRILLRDAKGNYLRSYVEIEHQNADPPHNNMNVYNEQTAIRITYLGATADCDRNLEWLNSFGDSDKSKPIILQYGEQMQELNGTKTNTTFQYQPNNFIVNCKLQLEKNVVLQGQLSLQNVIGNSSLRVRLYYSNYEIIAMLGIGFISNGYFPKLSNTLIINVSSITIEPTKKLAKNWILTVHGTYAKQIMSSNNPKAKLYVQNDTKLLFQYFQQTEQKDQFQLQPFSSALIRVNSLSWTAQYQAQQTIRLYNSLRGITINISLKCSMLKNQANFAPQYSMPDYKFQEGKSKIKIDQIKMTGAYFNEIFTQNTVLYFVYNSFWGNKTIFPAFTVKSTTQYIINCKQSIEQEGGGELCLVTYDHYFGKQKQIQQNLQYYLVFKIIFKNIKQLSQSKVIYNDKFIGFAKKIKLVQPCKKFDMMMTDRTLQVNLNYKQYPLFQPGQLSIINCMLQGSRNSRVQISMVFDSSEFHISGEGENYLMDKPYTARISSNPIQFTVVQNQVTKQIHGYFQELFGNPQPNTSYKLSIPYGDNKKLTLLYKYQKLKLTAIPKKGLQTNQILKFSLSTQINIKIIRAYVKAQTYKNCVVRVTKGSNTFQTLPQNPCNQLIQFCDCQLFNIDSKVQSQYIFFNLYGTKTIGDGQETLAVFVGHYRMKNIIGKGCYQLILSQMGDQQNKSNAIIIFQVVNNLPILQTAVKFTTKSFKFVRNEYIKSIMKYYIVLQINNVPMAISQLMKTNDILNIGQKAIIRNGQDLVIRIYSSSKALSKQGFWSSEKELIGSGKLTWAQIELNGTLQLNYLPSKDIVSKLNGNALALLQTQGKILPISYDGPTPNNLKPKPVDIQVQSGLAAVVNILEIIPQVSHQKVLDITLLPFNFQFCVQSKLTLNKEFIVQLQNKKLSLVITKSKKYRQTYSKQTKQQVINFKGKRIKTTQKFGFSVNVPGICIIKASAILLSNKFTTNYKGTLSLTSFKCDNVKLKQIQIYCLDHPSRIREGIQKLVPIKTNITNKQGFVGKQVTTNTITFALYIVATFEDKQRVKSIINLANVHMQKLQERPFKYQWIIYNNGPILCAMQGQYKANKIEKANAEKIEYAVQADVQLNKVVREINSKEKIQLLNDIHKLEVARPDRKRGYRIIVLIPDAFNVQSVAVVLFDESVIVLRKAQHNAKSYVHTSAQQLKISTIRLQSTQIQRVQQLEQKNFTRRFLINRNPIYIVKLISQPYAIADCKKQQFVVSFTLHQIFSQQTSAKLLWLRSNKNDEILTRRLALLVKHGNQKGIIRPIDEKGNPYSSTSQIDFKTVSFGFQTSVDQLEVYLCINHALNQKQQANNIWTNNITNWMKLLPVAYGKINLQKINSSVMVGCELKKIENFNETLDKQLNKIIMLPTLTCLGSIHMERRSWGFISLQIQQMSAIQLSSDLGINSLIYLSYAVQNTRRIKIIGNVTQARQFIKKQKVAFLINKLKWNYMQQKGETQSLKIVGTILTSNNNFILFQKRVDLSQYLRIPGQHRITVQIKSNQCQGVKNMFQIKCRLTNTSEPIPQIDIVQQAKRINTVDLISFEGMQENDLIKKLLSCQQSSHLAQVMREVKQSVIYSKQSQFALFRTCGYYLQFQNDSKIISTVLEMMNIQLLKYPDTLQKLTDKDVQKFYSYLKILFQTRQQQIPQNLQKKLSASDYSQFMNKSDQNEIDKNIKIQKRKLYSPQQLIKSSSLLHIQQMIPLISQLIQKSKKFRDLFKTEVKDWNQLLTFKENNIFVKYIRLLDKAYLNDKIPFEICQDILKMGLKKNVASQSLIQIWSKLPNQQMGQNALHIFVYIVEKLDATKENSQNIQSFRTMINFMNMAKIKIPQQNWQQAVSKCITMINSSNDFYIINAYSQLVMKIASLGVVQQKIKLQLVQALKKKLSQQNDKNIKLLISNFIQKVNGKKQINTNQTNANKAQFYKKYLITS